MTRRVVGLSLLAAGTVAAAITLAVLHAPAPPESGPVPGPTAGSPTAPAATTTTPLSPRDRMELAEDVAEAVARVVADTRIGLAVYDDLTGSMLTTRNADEPFYTASVVKLLIAMHVLRDAGWSVPTGPEREDLTAMLSHSADRVASTLWEAHGGATIVREMAMLMGLSDTSPPRAPEQWELTRMSARDVLAVYTYLRNEIPEQVAGFVLSALSASARVALDGFDQHFGIPAALGGTEVAVKQGWMLVEAGLVLNTTGLVGDYGRYTAALLTLQPDDTGFAEGRAAVTAGIRALAPALATEDG